MIKKAEGVVMLTIKTTFLGLLFVLLIQPVYAAHHSNHTGSPLAGMASTGPVHRHGTFIFNPRTLIWTAYAPDGTLVRSGYGSGGANYCKDIKRRCHTPVGTFYVHAKGSANCKSSKYPLDNPGAPMPWCMFFRGGYAIHGSNDVRSYNASHGCIRVTPIDAQWLHRNLIEIGTLVIIKPY